MIPFILAAETVPKETIHIAKFKDDRAGAISYTFDDGNRSHYTLGLAILQDAKVKASFFIVPNSISESVEEAEAKDPGALGGITWDEVRELLAAGHEIGNHCHYKASIIDSARETFFEELGIYPPSYVYPGNHRDKTNRPIVMKDHLFAREYEARMGKEHKNPNYLNRWADKQAAEGNWGVAMIHGINAGYDPIRSDVLSQHLQYTGQHAKLWVDTFANVGRYVRLRETAKLTISEQTARSARFVLSSPLDPKFFNAALTVVIPHAGATEASASTENGIPLQTHTLDDSIQVECPPSEAVISVHWK